MEMRTTRMALLVMLFAYGFSSAAEKNPFPDLPPKTPQEALATFDLHPGFQIELVASEPLYPKDEWRRLSQGQMVLVDHDRRVEVRQLALEN